MFRRNSALFAAVVITASMIIVAGCSSESGGGGGGGTELPDLEMPDLYAGPASSVEAGQPVSVRYHIRNNVDDGDLKMAGSSGMLTAPVSAASTDAGPFKVTFYFSTDTDYDAATDQAMSPVLEMDGMKGDGFMADSNWVMDVPSGMTPGDYYVFAIVDCDDQVEESDETNNMGIMYPGYISVFAPGDRMPNIEPFSAAYHDALTVGQSTTFTIGFSNFGMVPTDAGCPVALYISEDSVVGPGDVLIDGAAGFLPPMATGEVIEIDFNFTVPGDIIGGAYIIFQADPEDAVAEGNENDNTYAINVTISE